MPLNFSMYLSSKGIQVNMGFIAFKVCVVVQVNKYLKSLEVPGKSLNK